MKIKETHNFFFLSIGFVIAELLPFSKLFSFSSHCKPMEVVNKISQEPLEPGS